MGQSKLPLKFGVFKYVAEAGQPVTRNDIFEALKAKYDGERQFTKERIDLYLSALACVSMIREVDVDFDEQGAVVVSYELEELGRSRLKYLPKGVE